jgi:tRNA threonylcarbamoyladenosine biosynthesis protein TsaB
LNILSVDSSSQTASVAVNNDGKTLVEIFLNTGLVHGRTLVPVIESTVKYSGLSVEDIDLFSVCGGPGSFTGIRIGMSAVKGMMFALNKPCVSISSLEVLAFNMVNVCDGVICPCLDLRRGNLYNSIFKSDGENIIRLTQDRNISTDNLLTELKNYNEKIYFVGDNEQLCYNSWISDSSLINFYIFNNPFCSIKASNLGLLAYKKYSEDNKIASDEVYPTYLNLSQAEKQRQKNNIKVKPF